MAPRAEGVFSGDSPLARSRAPQLHGIHHSIVMKETHSNWSTLFTFPDYLHGTLRLNIPQQEITIGVPAYQDPAELTLERIMAMPLTAHRPSWQFLDGGRPERGKVQPPLTELAV
jgi:hypothetical protein